MSKMEEQIIVVSREKLFCKEKHIFDGFMGDISTVKNIINKLADNFEIMRRGDAENNPEYKQPIPYAIIRKGDKIFTYRRLTGGGEERLHNRMSIGVGGHMNDLSQEDKDALGAEANNFYTVLSDNISRELNEELFIGKGDQEQDIIGLINDDSDDVGKVHIGVLVIIDISEDTTVDVQEKEQLEGTWLTIDDLIRPENYSRLENWSKIAVEVLK